MTAPFSVAADFGGLTKGTDLLIGEALHRANITGDEKGTEAAAATALMMLESANPEQVEMTLNRPFVFVIQEHETGSLLFTGRVTDPE